MRITQIGWIISTALLSLLLSGCLAGRNFVSVERKFAQEQSPTGYHVVGRGETLYSIAWRYGHDYRQLASANGISSPFTIFPGQRIDVSKRVENYRVASSFPPARPPSVNTQVTVTPKPVKKPSKTHVVSKPLPPPAVASVVSPPPTVNMPTDKWIWPAEGELIGRFSVNNPVNKGVDILGKLGEPVLSAAAGTVVYAGQGLRGYGNLVIVKHNDTYLSAYAHTSRILVKEQQVVQIGEKIAEIGSTGTDRVMLHFEIRQNGTPVDPQKYLPKRSYNK